MIAWKNARKTYDDNHVAFYDDNLAGNTLSARRWVKDNRSFIPPTPRSNARVIACKK